LFVEKGKKMDADLNETQGTVKV